ILALVLAGRELGRHLGEGGDPLPDLALGRTELLAEFLLPDLGIRELGLERLTRGLAVLPLGGGRLQVAAGLAQLDLETLLVLGGLRQRSLGLPQLRLRRLELLLEPGGLRLARLEPGPGVGEGVLGGRELAAGVGELGFAGGERLARLLE